MARAMTSSAALVNRIIASPCDKLTPGLLTAAEGIAELGSLTRRVFRAPSIAPRLALVVLMLCHSAHLHQAIQGVILLVIPPATTRPYGSALAGRAT